MVLLQHEFLRHLLQGDQIGFGEYFGVASFAEAACRKMIRLFVIAILWRQWVDVELKRYLDENGRNITYLSGHAIRYGNVVSLRFEDLPFLFRLPNTHHFFPCPLSLSLQFVCPLFSVLSNDDCFYRSRGWHNSPSPRLDSAVQQYPTAGPPGIRKLIGTKPRVA